MLPDRGVEGLQLDLLAISALETLQLSGEEDGEGSDLGGDEEVRAFTPSFFLSFPYSPSPSPLRFPRGMTIPL